MRQEHDLSGARELYQLWIHRGLMFEHVESSTCNVAGLDQPRERVFIVVTFDQDYKSSGLSNVMRKRQYWVKEGAAWKIIYEGSG